MPLILAIEPDHRQAAHVRGLVQHRVGAELVLAGTTEDALDAIGNRVPDLVLVPALLAPQDDAALAAALRVIAAASRVRTLTIPVLAHDHAPKPAGGLLGRWRSNAPATPHGCDPALFADQIRAYLREVAEERAELDDSIEPTPVVAEQAIVVEQPVFVEEPVFVDEPILVEQPVLVEQPLIVEQTAAAATIDEFVDEIMIGDDSMFEIVAAERLDPNDLLGLADMIDLRDVDVPDLAVMDLSEELERLAAHDIPAVATVRTSDEPLPLTPWRAWPRLEGMPAEVVAIADEPTRGSDHEWVELVASLRQDLERRRHETVTAKAPPKALRKAKPVQDEWGFFDPEQCGFSALLKKLDEITVIEESA